MRTQLFALPLFLVLTACPSPPPPRVPDTVSPKESPVSYKVLADELKQPANTVEYHVLIDTTVKHEPAEALLKFLYRYLSTRTAFPPAAVEAYVYSNPAQYQTPPRSPIASVYQKSGQIGPTFENKVPLEFCKQVDQNISHLDKGFKLEKKVTCDEAAASVVVLNPYNEPGKDEFAETLPLSQALNTFTDMARALFENVPDLKLFKFTGTWCTGKDKTAACEPEELVRIEVTRAAYGSLELGQLEEKVGQLHGRAFLELANNRGSDKSVSAAHDARLGGLYKDMLKKLGPSVFVSPKLK